jgi:Cu-Zn family superoxide dismutase
MSQEGAVAVFRTPEIEGDIVAMNHAGCVRLVATFTKLPPGKHGFHIHKAGDLRGEGCMGLCEHFDVGHHSHGGSPTSLRERHTGDLGNIEIPEGKKLIRRSYDLKQISVKDLWGRSIIVHEDQDDLGRGPFEDSLVTGHSGKRMGCAIFGRTLCSTSKSVHTTRKHRKSS